MTDTSTQQTDLQPTRLGWTAMRSMSLDRIGSMFRAVEEQGPVAHYKALNIDIFYVTDPDVIRELIVRRPHQLHRDPFTTNVLRRILGEGLFIAEDEAWARQRKLVAPAFHTMRVRAYAATMAGYTREMTARFVDGEVRELDRDMTQLTLRIIAKTMFNVDLLAEADRIGRLTTALLETVEAQLDSFYPPPNWIPTAVNRKQNRALAEFHDLMRGIIREAQAAGRDEGDLLSMLIQARDEEGQPMSEAQLLDECTTLMFAGHETTAVALMWTWLLLAQNPHATERLYAEVDEQLRGEPVTFERLADLPYTEWTIKEALRLFPPAFSFGRTPLEPISLEVGGRHYHFRKGAVLLMNTMAMHRLPEFYPDPDAFRPERWAADAPQPPKYAYLPFGAGPRVCVGNSFAMMEAQIILATMVQRVRLSPPDTPDMTPKPMLTLRPKERVRMRVNCR